jgi:uncharacterized membrane protein YbhN (UPF0104 family)
MSEEPKDSKKIDTRHTGQYDDPDFNKALKSISPGRIALAVVIGLAVVVYMFVKEFHWDEFNKIQWNGQVFFWLGMAVVFMCTRHLSYMTRLRIVTNKFFSWKKCLELIVVWEFSSAVTPTSVGGSAVALFALSQEKLPAGRTTMLVLYTVILDTFFFLFFILLLFLLFGPLMVQPGAQSISDLLNPASSIYGKVFFFAYAFMFVYGSLFFYGVFVSSKPISKILLFFTGFKFLKRFRSGAEKMAEEMRTTSVELKNKTWLFHLKSFGVTIGAWTSKFMVLNCLILGFVSMSSDPVVKQHYNEFMSGNLDLSWPLQQFLIYARQLAMWIITAITPTPGGSGIAENAFMIFHKDYIPANATLLLIMAVFWRFFTYYVYLIVGMIVVPNWVRKLINRNKKERAAKELGFSEGN